MPSDRSPSAIPKLAILALAVATLPPFIDKDAAISAIVTSKAVSGTTVMVADIAGVLQDVTVAVTIAARNVVKRATE
eukprot:jgi/Bigna1/136249/aug1.33_g10957